jgi:hypothetical protein
VDSLGNIDPNPPVFSWTINPVIPRESIEQLLQLKHSMHLDFATDRILDAQLNAALQFKQHNLKSGACGHLNGFVIQVPIELQVGHVTHTSFPANTSSTSCRERLGLLNFERHKYTPILGFSQTTLNGSRSS